MQHCRPFSKALNVSSIVLGCMQACTMMPVCEATQQCLLMPGINRSVPRMTTTASRHGLEEEGALGAGGFVRRASCTVIDWDC